MMLRFPIHIQGHTCNELMGGGVVGHLGPAFNKNDLILQRHNAPEAQTYISILMVDGPYIYPDCLSYYNSIFIVFHNSHYEGSSILRLENFGTN